MVSDNLYGNTKNSSKNNYNADEVIDRANRSLLGLEDRGLIVDPAFAGAEGAVILLGLVPLRFSNRTGRGDDVYHEIRVQAPLWDFTYESRQPIRGKRFERSWSINVRGVQFVRGLLTDMAKRFLVAESADRRDHSEPVMPPPRRIEFADDTEERK